MRDKAYIRLIDAHAEGNRCDDDYAIITQKTGLVLGPYLGRQTGVIGQCFEALFA